MNRKNVEDLYPLSPLQQGMLFHTLYAPGSGAYLEQMVMTLEGPVHPEPFRRAWQKVIDRHPVLRTGFVWEGVPQPLQIVFRQVDLPFEFEDWRSLSASEQERRLAERLERERLDGLDLSRPYLRVRLYRTADDEHRFVLTTHHMLLDGWSLPILLGEFDALYGGFVRGQEPRLPVRRPFREYIAWLSRQDAGAAEAFWRGRLAGFQAPTPLPLDQIPARAGAPAEDHARERVEFPAALAEALEQSARTLRVTPSGLLQCAWGAVLAAYAGERDVVFGATVSGRPPELPGVEEMVGMFINTVPVRIEVPRGVTVEAWVQAAHRDQSEARLYEHAQLAQVRTWSQVPPEGPLFETLLVYENYPLDALGDDGGGEFDASAAGEEEGFQIAAATSPERTNYPLALVAAPSPIEFRLSATYDPARLSGASVRALLNGLGHVLRQIIADPAGPVEALTPFGSDAVGRPEEDSEPARLLRLGEGPSPEIPPLPIHRLFEQQAAARPDAAALVTDDGRITYAELNARANRLARRLRELGVGVESRVGVSMDRSPELTVTLLAILKAGAASVPLDPLYPPERRALMRRDACVTLVVTNGTGDSGDGDPSIPVLSLVAERERIAALSGDDLDDVEVDPENLAYVLFTSGSTGTPKGVGIPHRAAVRLVRGQTFAHLGPETVFLQLAPAAFDAMVLEAWAALLNGGTVAVHPPILPAPEELGAFLTRHGVTTAWITAGLFNQLVDAGAPGLRGLRQVISGGEVLSPSHVRRAMELLPGTRLTNGYGPTESTTFTLTHAIGADDLDGALPIGLPIANTRACVLDARMRAVPAGVPGELFVGGLGLARGYVGRPGMTAERFVPDPFTSGQRLYRTGDRVRWSTHGEVEFLGRMDRQVKLRGFRIEPGEIETALLAHPSVRAAVVDVREGPGGRRLVAWVATVDDGAPDAANLQGHLSRTLPDYMVPTAFVAVDAIPLTANGKVDRAALPDPGAPESAAYVAPRTATETRLAEIWVEVLKLERVGADDSFFALGGHSLLATQIVSRARAAFGVELPLRTLFAHPTLEGLAAEIDAMKSGVRAGHDGGDAPASDASGVVPVARDGELPTALQQERLWFIDRMDPGTSGYTIAAALELTGTLDAPALGRALNEIVQRHEALRTVFAEVAGHPVQRVQPAGDWAMAVEDLSADGPRAAESRAEDRIREEAARPFDLARGPLFRATLLRLDENRHALLITVHHVVFDGWSMSVFLRELSALYAAFRRSLPSPLPALPVQYGDYAAWQRSEAAGTDRQLEWWRAHLAGAPHVLDLPTDRPRPAARTMRGGHVDVSLDADVLRRVKDLAHAEGATPFMVLLAAWQLLLARYAGADEVLVGSPIAGRTRQETEGLIGFFVNTLVMRGRVPAGQPFRALLAAVRDDVLGAFAHQDVPFERLVDVLKVERDLARTPLYQAMFTLQNAAGDAPTLDGLAVEGLGVPFEAARTDLSLSLNESADGLHGTLEFSADVFTRETAERIVAHYGTLLGARTWSR